MIFIEDDFFDDLDEFLLTFPNPKRDEVEMVIREFINYGILTKESLEALKDDLSLDKKDIKKILEFAKKYKNKLPIWPFNGFSIEDLTSKKEEKVGRNDPCPCGSGKKYKQCHGK